MVNNHGDRKSPRRGVVGPLPNGLILWFRNGGDPNYLLSGMILQVEPQKSQGGVNLPLVPFEIKKSRKLRSHSC